MKRHATVTRKTLETDIELTLNLDGQGSVEVQTGIGFYDHLLTLLAFHAKWDLKLSCRGDLDVDDHHTVEDCALALGEAFHEALGERRGIARFASSFAPMDESLARAVIDLSGRPHASLELSLARESLGSLSCENIPHIFASFAQRAGLTLHLDVLRGENDHHKAEAAFKAMALALRDAIVIRDESIPSTKGSLE